jgi:hypothetical protein
MDSSFDIYFSFWYLCFFQYQTLDLYFWDLAYCFWVILEDRSSSPVTVVGEDKLFLTILLKGLSKFFSTIFYSADIFQFHFDTIFSCSVFGYLLNSQLTIISHHSSHFFHIWMSSLNCHAVGSFFIYNIFLSILKSLTPYRNLHYTHCSLSINVL